MKKSILLLAISALVLLMTLAGCERGKNFIISDDSVTGSLTINNCPEVHGVLICNNIGYVSSTGLLLALKKPYAQSLRKESPFPIRTSKGKGFKDTGTFLVVIIYSEPTAEPVTEPATESTTESTTEPVSNFKLYFLENVNFNKGSAAIDFNDMKSSKSLYSHD